MPEPLPLTSPQLSVIIPARNEEASLGSCLESLVSQTGVDFEIIVVNDHSTDRTREIAESFKKVSIIDAAPLPEGWTGKNNAVATGAREARGQWLLFTDADTIHTPGSLDRALKEPTDNKADVLSYSPEQIAVTFWEMAILPVVFAELARRFPPSKVSDPNSPEAAANGQFILIRRDVYDAIGGHASVASEILEDVALARRVKAAGYKLRFRYSESVRTRMYRNFAQLREGWTKNLALLFPKPGWLAVESLALWAVPWAIAIFQALLPWSLWWWGPVFVGSVLFLIGRLKRANFDSAMTFLGALFGMPMFAYLLLRSKRAHTNGTVGWKGRTYEPTNHSNSTAPRNRTPSGKSFMKTPLALFVLTISLTAISLTTLRAQPADDEPHFTTTVIEPGEAIGPLKINDSHDRALQLFPKKDIDQEWEDPCGTTIDWIDSSNPIGHGDVFIRMKKGKIFQIESSTTRFTTAEGITIFDPPEKVEHAYKDMRAGVLLGNLSPALGSRPLVFWFDKKKGIAFAFAYDRPHHKRYIYKIIVFEPGKNFCPEQEVINSNRWQNIEPYSQEPPKDLSPEP
jgi:glycosyltransferase involved in cell wall biosynthesis